MVTRDCVTAWRHLDDRSTLLYPWQPEKFVFDEADKKDVDAILFSTEVKHLEPFEAVLKAGNWAHNLSE